MIAIKIHRGGGHSQTTESPDARGLYSELLALTGHQYHYAISLSAAFDSIKVCSAHVHRKSTTFRDIVVQQLGSGEMLGMRRCSEAMKAEPFPLPDFYILQFNVISPTGYPVVKSS